MSVPGVAQILVLNQDRLRQNIVDVIRLDSLMIEELGVQYSHEKWGEREFLLDLPGKWQLSRMALRDGGFIGFWIASKRGEDAQTHRVAVVKEERRGGVAARFFEAICRSARQEGCRRLTLTAGAGNASADGFYRKMGFSRLVGRALEEFLNSRPGSGRRQGDQVVVMTEKGEVHYNAWAYSLEKPEL